MMITAMLDSDEKRESILFVVLEPPTIKRLEEGVVTMILSEREGGNLGIPAPKYPRALSLVIGYEPDDLEAFRMARGDTKELQEWLLGGGKFIEGVDKDDGSTNSEHPQAKSN